MGHGHGVLHQRAAEVRNYMPGPWESCGELQARKKGIPKEDTCTSGDITREVALSKPFGVWKLPSQAQKPDMEWDSLCFSAGFQSCFGLLISLTLCTLYSCFWNRDDCSVPLSI